MKFNFEYSPKYTPGSRPYYFGPNAAHMAVDCMEKPHYKGEEQFPEVEILELWTMYFWSRTPWRFMKPPLMRYIVEERGHIMLPRLRKAKRWTIRFWKQSFGEALKIVPDLGVMMLRMYYDFALENNGSEEGKPYDIYMRYGYWIEQRKDWKISSFNTFIAYTRSGGGDVVLV